MSQLQTTETILADIERAANLTRRQVWCRECGATQVVANGLRNGWPKCCGFTMTIDPPDTWKK